LHFICLGNYMSFAVGTYREVKDKCKGECMLCFNNIKLSDPVILQQNTSKNDDITCVHLTCFMKQIQDNFPEFWKQYILELI